MDFAIIIPARYASTRFPGKPLVPLKGVDGAPRSLIARCIDAARKVPNATRVAVATDDPRVAAEAERAGAEAVMTSSARRNGTERVAEAAATLGLFDLPIVNLQGDAPLTPPAFVNALIGALSADPTIGMATPVLRADPLTISRLLADRSAGRVGGTTAVVARTGDALYFSKEVLPFHNRNTATGGPAVFLHLGLYAYRPDALAAYASWPPSPLEEAEGLEQLRFLEAGAPVRTVEVDPAGRSFWEVNNAEDVPMVEAELRALGIP